jgi:hypothetical protein
MKNIKDYKPYKGFYDLREYNLPKEIFIKFWNVQDYLNHVNERKQYFMEKDKITWRKSQELSANYQMCLASYDHTTATIRH